MGTRSTSSFLRRMVASLIIVPMALVALLLAPTSAVAAETLKFRFKGTVVSGYNERSDPECESATVHVSASRDLVTYTGATYDRCFGFTSFVWGTATPTTFQVSDGGTSVRVVASIPLYDGRTGASLGGAVQLDNTWTTTTEATRSKLVYSTSFPDGYRYSVRSKGVIAEASVDGTVDLGHAWVGEYQFVKATVRH